MRAVSGQQDLPGYSQTQETETLGLLAVQTYLVRHGFKVALRARRHQATIHGVWGTRPSAPLAAPNNVPARDRATLAVRLHGS